MTARGLKQGDKRISIMEQRNPLRSLVLTKDLFFRAARVFFFSLNSSIALAMCDNGRCILGTQ